ncbi:hypothetical protein KC352_g29280, partial [Hortaea werneckii]
SEWDIKQMAGNIIPAIATSNALTASLCVMEAFKIIRSQPAQQQGLAKPTTNNHLPTETQSSLAPPSAAPSSSSGAGAKPSDPTPALGGSKMVFLNSRSTERMITTQHLMPPNPTCPVCSPVYAKLLVPIADNTKATLHELVLLLKEKTGFEDFSLTTPAGVIYDPDLEDNLPKPLSEYVNQATGNEFLTVSDERSSEEGGRVDILLSPVVITDPAKLGGGGEGKLRLWPEELHLPAKPKKVGPGAEEEEEGVDGTAVVDGDGKVDLEGTSSSSNAAAAAAQKRKREAEEEVDEAKSQKKMKGDGDVLVVQDDEAILID